jgi:uncharacterized protein YggU (UPF0235/DUF167 family)
VPKTSVRLVAGATSQLKQVAVDGDGEKLGEILRVLTSGKSD